MHCLHCRFLILTLLLAPGWVLAQRSPVVTWQQQLGQASSDSSRVRLCLAIAQYYYSKTQYDSLYPYVQRGLSRLSAVASPRYVSELNFLLSRYYRDKGRAKKGLPYGQLALKQALTNNDPKRVAELGYYLAVLYSDAGELSNAVDQIGANLRYLHQHDDGPIRAANYILMMNQFEELRNVAMRRLYWQKYIALDKRSWPVEDKMLAYANIGAIMEEQGQLKQAEGQYQKALHYASLIPAPAIPTIEFLQALGSNVRKQGQYQPAIVFFQRALIQANAINNITHISSIRRELALTYQAFHKPEQALREAQYALLIARQQKLRYLLIEALNSLGTVLEAQGDYRQALQLYREEQHLKEQKFTEANVQKIALMQAQFETETKENTIKLLQKSAQINRLTDLRQQEQLATARRTQAGGALLILLLFILAGGTIYNLRQSRWNNALLLAQQTLLQQTAQQLTESNGQLVESNSVKDKLFSLIAHDLRSPVASIKNSLVQLRQPLSSPTPFAPELAGLDQQVDRLLGLLTNLLDWAMIQLKATPVRLSAVALPEVVAEVLSQVGLQIDQKQIRLINQINGDHLVLANPYQLQAVVRNLLTNAVKFTPEAGSIRLVSYQKGDQVELQVRDSGVGMSAEQLAILFTAPEVQPSTQGERGTGLGLRLCLDMLARQGGQLQVESQLGRGTTVRVRLVAGLSSQTIGEPAK